MKLFLPQAQLEEWALGDKADLKDGKLVVMAEGGASFPAVPAVHFVQLVTGEDTHKLVAKVKTEAKAAGDKTEEMARVRAEAEQRRLALEAARYKDNRITGPVGDCLGKPTEVYGNGMIPADALCPLWAAPGHRLRADVGIVCRDVAAAHEIEREADNRRECRNHDQQDLAAVLPEPAERLGRLRACLRTLLRRRRRHDLEDRIGRLGRFRCGFGLEGGVSHSVALACFLPRYRPQRVQ